MLVKYKEVLNPQLKELLIKLVKNLVPDVDIYFFKEDIKDAIYYYEVTYDSFVLCYIVSKKPLDLVVVQLLRKTIINSFVNFFLNKKNNDVIKFTQKLTNYIYSNLFFLLNLLYEELPSLTGFDKIKIYFRGENNKFFGVFSQEVIEFKYDLYTNYEFLKLDEKYILTIPIKIKDKVMVLVEYSTDSLDYIIIDRHFKSVLSVTLEVFFLVISHLFKQDSEDKEVQLSKSKEDILIYLRDLSKVLGSVLKIDKLLQIVANIAAKFIKAKASFVVKDDNYIIVKNDLDIDLFSALVSLNKSIWDNNYKEYDTLFFQENVFNNLNTVILYIKSRNIHEKIYIVLVTQYNLQDLIKYKSLLETLTEQLSLAIENILLMKKYELKGKHIAFLHSAYKDITNKLRYEDAFNAYFLHLSKLAKLKRGFILLKEKLRNVFTVRALFNVDDLRADYLKSIAISYNILENKSLIDLLANKIVKLKGDNPFYHALNLEDNLKDNTLVIPFFFNNKLVGISYLIFSEDVCNLSKDTLQLMKNITDYLSNALDTCNLYNKLTLNLKHNETLLKISTSLSSTLDINKIYKLIIEETSKLLDDSKSILFIYDKNTKSLSAKYFHLIEDEEFFVNNSLLFKDTLVYKSLKSKRRYYTANIVLDIDNPFLAQKLKEENLGACLIIPIRNKNRNIGVILYSKEVGYQFNTEQINFITNILNQAALNIENAIYYAELEERIRHLSFLFYSAKEINSSLEQKRILKLALTNFVKTFKANAASIVYFDKDRADVRCALNIDKDHEFLSNNFRLNNFFYKVYKTNSIVFRNSVINEEDYPESLKQSGFYTFIIVPLVFEKIAECSFDIRNSTFSMIRGAVVLFFKSNRVFSVQEFKILKAIIGILSIALRNAEIFEKQLNIAKIIQENVISVKIPQYPKLDIGKIYYASKDISGDFYEFLESEDENSTLGFVLADVSGKGPKAAVYTVMAKYAIRAAYAIYGDLPNKLLTTANQILLSSSIGEDKFITMFALFIDIKEALISYSSAGHEPAFIYRPSLNSVIELNESKGLVLGVFDYTDYKMSSISYKKGDILVVFSDGITELKDEKGNLWGRQHLIDIVSKNHELSSKEIIAKIETEIMKYKRNTHLFDDITLFIFKFL